MYLTYDKDDYPTGIFGQAELPKVAKFVGLTLSSIRSYISKKRVLRNGAKLYRLNDKGTLERLL